MDPFWADDFTILIRNDLLTEIVPKEEMTQDEKLNALMRGVFYASVLLIVINNNVRYIYLLVITGILTYMMRHYRLVKANSEIMPMQAPSPHNPFMNVLLTDYVDQPNRGPAHNIEDPKIARAVEQHFNQGLFSDTGDTWDKGHSQRQFYVNPSTTIPNDRDSFTKWCYLRPPTCKEGNLTRCLKYEDLRA
jgi:hypothetical protein